MQRVTRDTVGHPADVVGALNAKVEIISQHFPPSIASLFAQPRTGGDGVLQWWSNLGGQPLPFAELNAEQQKQLLARYAERQEAIGHLADALAARGQDEIAKSLRSLIGPADQANLFALNGDPVVVRWGLPPVVVPAAPAAVAPPVPVKPVRKTIWLRLWPWLLWPLLLLLLLWALWFWRGLLWNWVQPSEVAPYACRVDAKAPDFAVVLDTSGSMNFNIGATVADEEWMNSTGEQLPDYHPRKMQLMAEPTRFTVAKQAVEQMTGQLHSDINTQLVSFDGCESTVYQGNFSAAQRPALIGQLQQLNAYAGTPLAASLKHAASLVDGRFKDAIVVMFADGEDGCGENICSVAQSIARQQPRLRVNVVNISDSELSNCVAEATGGRVYAARDSAALRDKLRLAIDEVAENPQCP